MKLRLMAMRWREEIVELHAFFEAYFLGKESSLGRVENALAAGFTMVGANGVESDRESAMRMILAGHAHTVNLSITTSDHRLLLQSGDTVVATYIEHHESSDGGNRRLSTVVFTADAAAPNGVCWLRVHETWQE